MSTPTYRIVNDAALIAWTCAFIIVLISSVTMGLAQDGDWTLDILRYIIPLTSTLIPAGLAWIKRWKARSGQKSLSSRTLDASRILAVSTGCASALLFALGLILFNGSLETVHEVALSVAAFALALGCYSQFECSQELTSESDAAEKSAQTSKIVSRVLAGITPPPAPTGPTTTPVTPGPTLGGSGSSGTTTSSSGGTNTP